MRGNPGFASLHPGYLLICRSVFDVGINPFYR